MGTYQGEVQALFVIDLLQVRGLGAKKSNSGVKASRGHLMGDYEGIPIRDITNAKGAYDGTGRAQVYMLAYY